MTPPRVIAVLPIIPPISTLTGNCWKCGKPLAKHPVYEGTCYPVCGTSA